MTRKRHYACWPYMLGFSVKCPPRVCKLQNSIRTYSPLPVICTRIHFMMNISQLMHLYFVMSLLVLFSNYILFIEHFQSLSKRDFKDIRSSSDLIEMYTSKFRRCSTFATYHYTMIFLEIAVFLIICWKMQDFFPAKFMFCQKLKCFTLYANKN